MQKFDTKKLTVLAMIAAMAFILAAVVRFPLVSVPGLTLRYDPKDIVIVIGGFLYGPFAAALVAVVVSLIQMVTVSATGIYGFIMNVIASCAFCCTAAFIYKRERSLKGAVIGLTAGLIIATAIMMMWNFIIVPIYLGIPREVVAELLLPVFLPFNLIGNGLNAAFTLLVYKYVKAALQAANLMPKDQTPLTDGSESYIKSKTDSAMKKTVFGASLLLSGTLLAVGYGGETATLIISVTMMVTGVIMMIFDNYIIRVKVNLGVVLASLFIILTCVLWVWAMQAG